MRQLPSTDTSTSHCHKTVMITTMMMTMMTMRQWYWSGIVDISNKLACKSKADHVQMRAFSYAWSLPVMRGHFQLCEKDGSHTTRSAITKNPMLLYVLYKWTYCQWKFYLVGISIFNLFAPVTLTLSRRPSYTWPVFAEDILDVCKQTSYIKSVKSYRITACECMDLVMCGHFQSLSHIVDSHTLSNPAHRQDYTVACLNYTLQTMMPLPGWPAMAPKCIRQRKYWAGFHLLSQSLQNRKLARISNMAATERSQTISRV